MMQIKFVLYINLLVLSSCSSVDVKNLPHLPAIPHSCKDSIQKYLHINSILSKGSYNTKAQSYSPIKTHQGFITADFDSNGKADYIFIERYKSDIRLISCINSKRTITPFKVHETIKPDFQTISESISADGKSLVLSINRHEHNWGSDSETSHYSYHNGKFRLDQREVVSSSGDGLRSDTYAFYNFRKMQYNRSSKCGNLEEGCKPSKEKGRIIPTSISPTLINQNKGYTRLVAED